MRKASLVILVSFATLMSLAAPPVAGVHAQTSTPTPTPAARVYLPLTL